MVAIIIIYYYYNSTNINNNTKNYFDLWIQNQPIFAFNYIQYYKTNTSILSYEIPKIVTMGMFYIRKNLRYFAPICHGFDGEIRLEECGLGLLRI